MFSNFKQMLWFNKKRRLKKFYQPEEGKIFQRGATFIMTLSLAMQITLVPPMVTHYLQKVIKMIL